MPRSFGKGVPSMPKRLRCIRRGQWVIDRSVGLWVIARGSLDWDGERWYMLVENQVEGTKYFLMGAENIRKCPRRRKARE
jgi:hypothetical protein